MVQRTLRLIRRTIRGGTIEQIRNGHRIPWNRTLPSSHRHRLWNRHFPRKGARDLRSCDRHRLVKKDVANREEKKAGMLAPMARKRTDGSMHKMRKAEDRFQEGTA